jgi:predicted nucleotidyltransferase component of viral defense system
MITRRQLREIHRVDLPLHIMEQDYIQSLLLRELYRVTDGLISKGGTFLRHAHGLDRYSQDLDFTLQGEKDPEGKLAHSVSELSYYGIEAVMDRRQDRRLSFTARLRYRGPLYDGSERSMGAMSLEVSRRDDLFLQPAWVRLFFEYPEARVVNVLGLQKEEILAEKLRALATRGKGRDLYDVWFLLKQGVEMDIGLFRRKMEVVGRPPRVSVAVSKSEWERDLRVLLPRPPEHSQVVAEVVENLRSKGQKVT